MDGGAGQLSSSPAGTNWHEIAFPPEAIEMKDPTSPFTPLIVANSESRLGIALSVGYVPLVSVPVGAFGLRFNAPAITEVSIFANIVLCDGSPHMT